MKAVKNSDSRSTLSTKLLVWLISAVMITVLLHLVFQFLNLNVYGELNGQIFELSNRLDLDDESSIGTWVSQAIFIAIAIAAMLAGYLNNKLSVRRLWYLIATIGMVFSIDEVASLHEFGLQSAHLLLYHENAPTFASNAWWVFVPIILLVAGWVCYQVFKHLPRKTLVLFVVGGFMIVFGAVVVDAFGSSLPKNSFTSQGIVVAIEELLELLGSSIILYATVAYIEQNFAAKIKKSLRSLKDS